MEHEEVVEEEIKPLKTKVMLHATKKRFKKNFLLKFAYSTT